MRSFLYLLVVLMFAGLGLMIWSSYKALRIAELNNPELAPSTPGNTPRPPVANPEVSRYVGISYFGLILFLLTAVGAIVAALKAMTHRF